MPAKPKFDYDSSAFYTAIGNLAARDYNDREIAMHIGEEVRTILRKQHQEAEDRAIDQGLPPPPPPDLEAIPDRLSEELFNKMKNGKYEVWSERENKLRSMLILQVLERARVNLCIAYKGVYDRLALGKVKTKTQTIVTRETLRDGQPFTETTKTETTTEIPPNLQALTTWRYHHDKEFRQVLTEMKRTDVTLDDKAVEALAINIVYNKREDIELQAPAPRGDTPSAPPS